MFSFKKFVVVFFCIILHSVSCSVLNIWCCFFLYGYIAKLQAHSQVYTNRKLLNLKKTPGRQVVTVLFSTEKGRKQNKIK